MLTLDVSFSCHREPIDHRAAYGINSNQFTGVDSVDFALCFNLFPNFVLGPMQRIDLNNFRIGPCHHGDDTIETVAAPAFAWSETVPRRSSESDAHQSAPAIFLAERYHSVVADGN